MNHSQFDRIFLCTRDQLKTQREAGGSAEEYTAADNAMMDFYIQQASRIMVDTVLKQLPLPYVDTMRFDAPHSYEDGKRVSFEFADTRRLIVGEVAMLLAITTLTNGDGTAFSTSDYKLYPANSYPKDTIRLVTSSTKTFDYDTDWEQAISVFGTWGYVPHYDSAWFDSTKDVPTGDISASATSFTFSIASDAGQFSAGDYIRIDSEVILVTESDSATGVVTIARAQLGTTAASHTATTNIEQFRQHQQIMSATAQIASAMYNKDRGIYDGVSPSAEELVDTYTTRLRVHSRANLI